VARHYGAAEPSGANVIIGPDGHLGTVVSSARFKRQIQPMDKASEVILALAPVTFLYKPELDPAEVPQFGLVAEEVEKVDPALVTHDSEGKAYSVRYETVNAMLLNEFLKEHRKVEKQQIAIEALREITAKHEAHAMQLQKEVEALAATMQKVSDESLNR
jgi:acid stress-induced BolA-like protein IbaG/YrbA